MTALPIPVKPTLGQELYIGPAHADADQLVLVCLGPGPLIGLPWKYIHPIAAIAVNAHHTHPALALSTAIAYSEDDELKTIGKAHLERLLEST